MTSSTLRSPPEIRNDLSAMMAEALKRAYGTDLPLPEVAASRNTSFGDLACSSAMTLARTLKRAPKEIAAVMAEGVSGRMAELESVTVDGPGFLNFTLKAEYLAAVALHLARSGIEGLMPETGSGRTALVEFVSSNPTGPLTVGHCRQAVLGDALSGLLQAVGWRVQREYYFNDGGRQMEKLAESLAARYMELLGVNMDIPDGGYHGGYLSSWAQELLKEHGRGLRWPSDKGIFSEYSKMKAFEMITQDLATLHIAFDRFFRESELIPGPVNQAMDLLRKKGLLYEEPSGSGKLWVRFTELGRPEDRVVVREDGTCTYRMPDIAYHLDKFNRGYDLIVNVFGSDHIDTCRDVEAAVGAILGEERVRGVLRTVIHQFVTLLRNGEKVKMSTRKGDFVTLLDMVEEAGSADVVRYVFLTRRAEAHMDFDLAQAASDSEDNPVFYVQYAFARISGILRNLSDDIRLTDAPRLAELLTSERERALMRILETVPLRVSAAAAALEPHRVTEILGEVATEFHGFYQHHRVNDPGDRDLTAARLTLCLAVRNTLNDLLKIIGVKAPEKM
jgi:arginyl-tRNA synthetase